jgi:hypothetical protein
MDRSFVGQREGLAVVFEDRADLPRALGALVEAGLAPGELGILAKAPGALPPEARPFVERLDEHTTEALAERMAFLGLDEAAAAAFAGYLALLGSLLLVAVPGIGMFVLAGEEALVGAIAAASTVAGVGLGALVGAIADEHRIESHREFFEERLLAGDWILLVRGPDPRIQAAEHALAGFKLRHKDFFLLPGEGGRRSWQPGPTS